MHPRVDMETDTFSQEPNRYGSTHNRMVMAKTSSDLISRSS